MTTPKAKNEKLKKRLQKAIDKLPKGWVITFIHVYPAYAEMKDHLYNVARGKSHDEEVIGKMEDLVLSLKPKK